MKARDEIRIEGLRVQCVVGVLPEERRCEQPVRLDLSLGVDSSTAGRSGRIADTIDYDRVSKQVSALLRFREFRLLEAAVEEISAMLFGVHKSLCWVQISLHKPKALEGRALAASVRVRRERADFEVREENTNFGRVQVLLETEEAGLYLLHIAGGGQIKPHYHQVMRELEFHVEGRVARDGVELQGLAPKVWPKGQVHAYQNLGEVEATLFCCDTPPFIEEDEILAQTELGSK